MKESARESSFKMNQPDDDTVTRGLNTLNVSSESSIFVNNERPGRHANPDCSEKLQTNFKKFQKSRADPKSWSLILHYFFLIRTTQQTKYNFGPKIRCKDRSGPIRVCGSSVHGRKPSMKIISRSHTKEKFVCIHSQLAVVYPQRNLYTKTILSSPFMTS